MILDTLLFRATAPGSSGAAANVAPPGSATLQPDNDPVLAYALAMGQAVTSSVQITTPSGHDTTRGWRSGGGQATARAQLITALPRVRRGETLSVTIIGSATAGDVEAMALCVAYPQRPGGEFIAPPSEAQIEHITSLQGSLTPTTDASWPAGTTLAALQDTLRANRRYAVLGASIGNKDNILCLALSGPETSWYKVAIPVLDQAIDTLPHTIMPSLAKSVGLPLVPVLNSGNKSQTTVGLVGNENATARTVTIYLALLR